MRRWLYILIACVLNVTLTAPLFAVNEPANNLPACCRRSGAHHCMNMTAVDPQSDFGFTAIPERCPRPVVATTVTQPHSFVPRFAPRDGSPLFARPAALPQTEARYRVSWTRCRQKRGPPVSL